MQQLLGDGAALVPQQRGILAEDLLEPVDEIRRYLGCHRGQIPSTWAEREDESALVVDAR